MCVCVCVIQGKERRPPLHLGVIAIEKGYLVSLSTTVANKLYIYMCVCVCVSYQMVMCSISGI